MPLMARAGFMATVSDSSRTPATVGDNWYATGFE